MPLLADSNAKIHPNFIALLVPHFLSHGFGSFAKIDESIELHKDTNVPVFQSGNGATVLPFSKLYDATPNALKEWTCFPKFTESPSSIRNDTPLYR
jgi:hypothetical protein